jgi:hypothetical protein
MSRITCSQIQIPTLIDGAVYRCGPLLVEAVKKHTWVLYVIDEDSGEYCSTSYVLKPDGTWTAYFYDDGPSPLEVQHGIQWLSFFQVAESRRAATIEHRFRSIMLAMDW